MQYSLTPSQLKRIKKGLRAVIAVPFIDDIEDYVVEAILDCRSAPPDRSGCPKNGNRLKRTVCVQPPALSGHEPLWGEQSAFSVFAVFHSETCQFSEPLLCSPILQG